MDTQILILLLFALRTGSGQLTSIPPAPTLPNPDISSFPEYMQRLLANRPSLIRVNKPNNNRAQNKNTLHDNNVNYQIPGANIGIPSTNGMNPKINQGYADHINNVKSEPLHVPQAVRKPQTYGMNLRSDKGEIWNDLTGRHLYVNDFPPSKSIHSNLLHNKQDEPTNPTTNNNKYKMPEQMDDQKRKLPSVTTVKPATLENVPTIVEVPNYKNINDSYHPSNSDLKSANLYYVTHEPLSEEFPASVEAQQDENISQNDDSHQIFPSILSSKPDVPYHMTPQTFTEGIPASLVVQEDKNVYHIDDSTQTFPSITTGKPDIPYNNSSPQLLSDKSSAILEVIKDKNVNHNDDAHQTFSTISTVKPDVPYHMNPQSLSEVPTIVDKYDNSANTTENENTTEISKESIENINLRDKIERSFDYINGKIGSNKEIKINQSPKSYGMKLAGYHGYVWNDLTKPGVHYNVGELNTTETTNPTTEEEMNPSEIPTEIPTFHEKDNGSNVVTEGPTDSSTANINEEPSTEKTTPESFHINPTTAANHINEQNKPSKNMSPELDDSFKKYIEKLVKEEVARQLGRNDTRIDASKNKACKNNSYVLESNKTPATNTESSNGHNNYGSIIGNGKVTNLFVFYPNDQKRKPIVSDATILNKPENEILNDMLNNDKTKNMPDSDVSIIGKSAITTESPVMTINTEPSQQGTNSGIAIDMHIARFKDEDNITPSTAVTSEVNVSTDGSAGIDRGNQTAQTTIAVQDNATQAYTSDNESTTVNPTGSSIDDIKTNATETESSSTDSIADSSVQEIENNNNATTQATSISDEAAELTTNADESNNTNDSVNSSIDTLNEMVDQTNNNETQAIPTISNEDAEITTISNKPEDNAVTSNESVTSEGTVTAEPADITSKVTMTDSTDNISTSSDIPLPSSSA